MTHSAEGHNNVPWFSLSPSFPCIRPLYIYLLSWITCKTWHTCSLSEQSVIYTKNATRKCSTSYSRPRKNVYVSRRVSTVIHISVHECGAVSRQFKKPINWPVTNGAIHNIQTHMDHHLAAWRQAFRSICVYRLVFCQQYFGLKVHTETQAKLRAGLAGIRQLRTREFRFALCVYLSFSSKQRDLSEGCSITLH